jgi:hypothetical protein
MTFTLADTVEGLLIAHEISAMGAFGIHELAGNYNREHQNSGDSPSDFQDLLEREFGISDYLIATVVLDGDIGNIEYDEDNEEEAKQIVANLRAIDAILWGKHQQQKTLSLTACLRASAVASQES